MKSNYYAELNRGLYDPAFDKDSCGVGFVANINGRRDNVILQHALTSLRNLAHRGGSDAATGVSDGTGVLTQIPFTLFAEEATNMGHLVTQDDLAVGVVFLPGEASSKDKVQQCQKIIEAAAIGQELIVIGWRDLPLNLSVVKAAALTSLPRIKHLLLARANDISASQFRRQLFLARKHAEYQLTEEKLDDCYIASLSNDTIVYKGLLSAPQLREFYLDLQDERFETAFAVFHQRFSTNTFPNWFFAQPFRLLAHNGEINTITGNQSWLRARESKIWTGPLKADSSKVAPILQAEGSDSAHLDNVAELLVTGGKDVLRTITMLIPEAWENMRDISEETRDFYEYGACLTEPWDGPAAVTFASGNIVGARLDRNGLRPARYEITDDGLIIVCSEIGTIDIDEAKVVEKGRIGPGEILAVDVGTGQLLRNDSIKSMLSVQKPYGARLQKSLASLPVSLTPSERIATDYEHAKDFQMTRAFDYSAEEMQFILAPMARGEEPIGSLGDDTPLAILSSRPRPLNGYFKQRFAQVTNPPIDSIRERLVMSLSTYLGARSSMVEETPESFRLLRLESPILTNTDMDAIQNTGDPLLKVVTLSATFQSSKGSKGLEPGLTRLCKNAESALGDGATILVISDRDTDARHAAIPMLLAVGAVHQHLIRIGRRMEASIVADTGEARDMHQVATLIGYGASAIHPYLAYRMIPRLLRERDSHADTNLAITNYKESLEKQLLKVMARMGISTITGYCGAQLFDAIGISDEVVERCFTGTTSQIGGLDFEDIAQETLTRHAIAFSSEEEPTKLADYGYYRFRRTGETHAFTPALARVLHTALEKDDGNDKYKQFTEEMNARGPIYLRDLLEFQPFGPPVPLDEVEPAKDIVRRLSGGSMSFGALSSEAHKAIATGFNKVGSTSGSGEGGEDPRRYGTESNSQIKQIASGRFGVTPQYLASARVLEIKMAQGSKPGEGGQLPAHKVTLEIARARLTQVGVQLISPPPHHDIYSIEDLAQLIYDLKMVNPDARIMVKLVSEVGVGKVAAGVAKAGADSILISGMEGGTGASPWGSIKNAGTPWELGLAETHQVLLANDLRSTVRLRADGGLRTGRDVIVAAMLGAEEFGFGTAALVAVGCVITRQCHLNTCPVGVATQDPELRKKFKGTPEMVVRYLFHVADEIRSIMASLGVRKIDEIIGRSELLRQTTQDTPSKISTLDLSRLLVTPATVGEASQPHTNTQPRQKVTDTLDDTLLDSLRPVLEAESSVEISSPIRNVDRTVGARIAGEIARRYGNSGLSKNEIRLNFEGTAGQSFGAFCVNGLRLTLEGEANDYVAKGMCGGEVVIRPSKKASFAARDNVIVGNTVLYGATGGRFFASGEAGERFAVRNSGAEAVIEGTGDHCCEYMTDGTVVVLGNTGRNFSAGMSGGRAFVLDLDDSFHNLHNDEMTDVQRLQRPEDIGILQSLITQHRDLTSSSIANDILSRWDDYVHRFWQVVPKQPARSYKETSTDTLAEAGD
ncbi:MAG: glutamate synthase large subunit [Chloroflexi bacterium]|nr:glutamate synthase large subunit [Chloroflexota bacterium]